MYVNICTHTHTHTQSDDPIYGPNNTTNPIYGPNNNTNPKQERGFKHKAEDALPKKRKSDDKNGPATMERAAYSVINCNHVPYMGYY